MRWKRIAGLLMCGMLISSVAHAEGQTPAVPQVGQAVIDRFGAGGGTFPKNGFVSIINYIYAEKDGWYTNGSRHSAASPKSSGKQRVTQNMAVVKFRYGLGNGYDVRSATPVGYMNFKNSTTLAPANSKKGFGDTCIALHKQFMSQAEGAPLSLAFDIGPWIPTGSTDVSGLGTGAWGALGGLGATWTFDGGRQLVEAEAQYLWRSKGGNKSAGTYQDVSDLVRVHGRYAYALSDYWDIGIETQFEHVMEGRQDGHGLNDANTTWFAGPAVVFKIPDWQTSLGLTAQFSLYQNYDGAVRIADREYPTGGSLGEKWRLEVKFAKMF